MDDQPLNPVLYRRLERYFGKVRISNEGISSQQTYRRDPLTGREVLHVLVGGEEYRVNCPLCRDTKFHLYINHTWGVPDVKGNRRLHLMNCYHGCYACYEQKKALYRKLFEPGRKVRLNLRAGQQVSKELKEVSPPGPVTPLLQLPEYHPAVVYLAGRGFDVAKLTRLYGLGYVQDSRHYLARERIYIPAVFGGKLVGWQCRRIGDPPEEPGQRSAPKYYTCPGMPKGRMLYNFDRARRWQTIVVVEGPTDVWSLGPMAVALWGATPTADQLRLLAKLGKSRTLVYLPDPEEFAKRRTTRPLESYVESLRGQLGGVAVVRLPDGTDPGSSERAWLRAYIREQAARQNVSVSWQRTT